MNIAIVGSKNVKKLADVLYQSFDGISVLGYNDVNQFREAILSRPLEFHRMILLEAAVSGDDVSTDDIYQFQEMILASYPAMKIITISTNPEFTKFLAGLFNGRNYGHFCFPSLKGKILVDIASRDIPELYRQYSKFAYKEEVESKEEILEENKIVTNTQVENKEEIEGYIPPTNVTEKRSFFDKIIGRGPVEPGNLTKESGLTHIGQGTGITEFSEEVPNIDFNGEQGYSPDPFAAPSEVPFADEPYSSEDVGEVDIFSEGGEVDLGLGNIPSQTQPVVHLEKEDIDVPPIAQRELKKEEPVPFDIHRLEKEEYVPMLDLKEEPKQVEEVEEEPKEIEVPRVDLGSLKKTVEETDFELSDDILNQPNVLDNLNLEVENADIELGAFEGNMSNLMSQYEDINSRPKEVIVEKIQYVERGTSSFRNKNGIKILIVSGDRRVGSTKLALNLANKYAYNEKVLYVDFDRNRHGSLGYLDLNGILEEPEHIQNGLSHLKNLNILQNVCHYYKKGKFYTLTSMYGTMIDNKQMETVQDVLVSQTEYTTVVIDCPLEDLNLLQRIIPFAKILLCVEDDKIGVINLLTMLNSTFSDESSLYTLFEKAYFVIGRRGRMDVFQKVLFEVIELFDLDEGMCKWGNVEIIGSIRDINILVERTGD